MYSCKKRYNKYRDLYLYLYRPENVAVLTDILWHAGPVRPNTLSLPKSGSGLYVPRQLCVALPRPLALTLTVSPLLRVLSFALTASHNK